MRRNGILIVIILILLWVNLSAEELINDLFQVEQSQKSARKAMLFSAIVPGAGQFYANPASITAYFFPLVEAGLWFGYFYYRSEGDDITKQYKQFADYNYDRQDQNMAQKSLIDDHLSDNNFYAPDDYDASNTDDYGYGGHFRLDTENTQHFYEDIGKYNKYLFGWNDWVEIYATVIQEPNSRFWTGPDWILEENEYGQWRWVGSDVMNEDSEYYIENSDLYDAERGTYSVLRAEYIEMRKDAEVNYENKRMCTYGLLFNHLLAAIDAVRVTRSYNIDHLSYNHWGIGISPTYAEGTINPSLMLTYKF